MSAPPALAGCHSRLDQLLRPFVRSLQTLGSTVADCCPQAQALFDMFAPLLDCGSPELTKLIWGCGGVPVVNAHDAGMAQGAQSAPSPPPARPPARRRRRLRRR